MLLYLFCASNQRIMIELPAIQERKRSHHQVNKYDSPYIKGSNVPTKVFKRLVSICGVTTHGKYYAAEYDVVGLIPSSNGRILVKVDSLRRPSAVPWVHV